MDAETTSAAIARLQSMASDVFGLRSALDAEEHVIECEAYAACDAPEQQARSSVDILGSGESRKCARCRAEDPVKGGGLPSSLVCRMDAKDGVKHSPVSMTFMVEKMELTDAKGTPEWERAPMQLDAEGLGPDAQSVLVAVVARDGGVQLGVAATYTDGQAVMLAQKGAVVYALRARPRRQDVE